MSRDQRIRLCSGDVLIADSLRHGGEDTAATAAKSDSLRCVRPIYKHLFEGLLAEHLYYE